jgi:hypothetical protein
MGIFTPEPWLVGLAVAKPDLDNLRLEEISGDLLAVQYNLESLYILQKAFESSLV